MMGVLVKKTYFRAPSNPVSAPDSIEEVETWMAIYHYDDKIGYAHSRVMEQPDGFMVLEKALMNLRLMGSVHRIRTETTGHLHEDGSLRSFVFSLESGLVRFKARGRVEGSHLVLKTGFGGEFTESKIVLHDKPVLSVGLWPHLVRKGVTVGSRYKVSVFDPAIMAQRPVDVEVMGRESIVLGGTKWDAFKVRTTFMGTDVFTWLGPNGERLKEEGFMGLRLVWATEDEARSEIRTDPETDMAEDASIPSNKTLENVSSLSYLTVRLDGVNLEGLDLHGGRQRLSGSVLEVARESVPLRSGQSASVERKYLESYLKAEPMVQSDHPRIKALAGNIVSAAKDEKTKARHILDWVYEYLDKRATVSVPNALGTLQAKAGDCNEHAVLFAALLRAVDIPTKLCAGLVYTRGRFYYHAWNEVFVGQWITADALMGQMPADVTHIRFVEGGSDRQADMVQVVGRLELKVLEAR